jgi:hypothetical protein
MRSTTLPTTDQPLNDRVTPLPGPTSRVSLLRCGEGWRTFSRDASAGVSTDPAAFPALLLGWIIRPAARRPTRS